MKLQENNDMNKSFWLILLSGTFYTTQAVPWPISNAENISGVYGTRRISGFFHSGIDLPSEINSLVHAPVKCKVVAVYGDDNNENSYIDLENVDSDQPAYFRLQHVATSYSDAQGTIKIKVGSEYAQGAYITQLRAYSGGIHLHLDMWKPYQYNVNRQNESKLLTANPLNWLTYDTRGVTTIEYSPKPTDTEYPTENGKRYIEVTVRQARPSFDFDKIQIDVMNSDGNFVNGDYFENFTGVVYETGWGIDKKQSAPSIFYGVKSFCDQVFSQLVPNKEQKFRFYLKETAPTSKPSTVSIRAYSYWGSERGRLDQRPLLLCTDCPPLPIAKPPEWITTTASDKGVKVSFSHSPSFQGSQAASFIYYVYRRTTTVEPYQMIGMVSAQQFSNPLSDPWFEDKLSDARTDPATLYRYAVATGAGSNQEGCTGPIAAGCTPVYNCNECPVAEAIITSPASETIRGILPSTISSEHPVSLTGAMLEPGNNSTISARDFVKILPSTHIQAGSTCRIAAIN
jgi:hypothetical protein